MERIILHCDLNYFYAAVEALFEPSYRHIPMAVGGDQDKRHGIILAKNPHAKKYGIQTGEPLWQAKAKCPNLVIVPARFSLYLRFSQKVKQIYQRYTDHIESFGIDEAWLDVSASMKLFKDPLSLAQSIAQAIYFECGITVSIGISFNKIFAKLGSDIKKPNGITMITKENMKQVVYPLPVEDLLYVGRATAKKLHRYGITTIGDLAQADPVFLRRHLHKMGEVLWYFANGFDQSEVTHISNHTIIKSVGNSVTTPIDMVTLEDILIVATVLAESVASRLKEQGLLCKVVSISMRDTSLAGFTRQLTLNTPTDISREILAAAMTLFKANKQTNLKYRSIGIKAEQLMPANQPIQLSLFIPYPKLLAERNIDQALDTIRQRFGFYVIGRGCIKANPILSGFNPKGDHVIFPMSYFRPTES